MTIFVEIILTRGSRLDRDEVEDLLDAEFSQDGEVTGAGMGGGRMNIDLEVREDIPFSEIETRVRNVLSEAGMTNWRFRIEDSGWLT